MRFVWAQFCCFLRLTQHRNISNQCQDKGISVWPVVEFGGLFGSRCEGSHEAFDNID